MTERICNISLHKRIYYATIFIFIYIIWSISFTQIGSWVSTSTQYTLFTSVDRAIPFIPEFEFIYLLCYLIPAVPVFVIQNIAQMNRLIITFILMNVFAFSIFILFPVYCPRPEFAVNSIATYLLSLEYSLDKPVNNFPSLHAAIAWLVFFSCRERSRLISTTLLLIATGICIAALFIKHHYIADIIAGILISWGIYSGIEYLAHRRASNS
jgi:membrane-associated phospholipid phosphatase